MKVRELKKWLEEFDGDTEVRYSMDCFRGDVELIAIQDGEELSTLNLSNSPRPGREEVR